MGRVAKQHTQVFLRSQFTGECFSNGGLAAAAQSPCQFLPVSSTGLSYSPGTSATDSLERDIAHGAWEGEIVLRHSTSMQSP